MDVVVISGFLTGLAGLLHCAGLCGSVTAMLMPAGAGATVSGQILLGRAGVYVAAGALVGNFGAIFGQALMLVGAQDVLRLLAGVAVVGTGLSVAGFLPSVSGLDGRLWHHFAPTGRHPLVVGAGLALLPCGMVVNALIVAAMTGGPVTGAAYMAAFACGALPGAGMASLGLAHLTQHARGQRRQQMRRVLGLAITVTGAALLAVPAARLTGIC